MPSFLSLSSMFANPMTSTAGMVSLVYALLGLAGVDVPGLPHVTPEMVGPLVMAGVTGLLAKDHNK